MLEDDIRIMQKILGKFAGVSEPVGEVPVKEVAYPFRAGRIRIIPPQENRAFMSHGCLMLEIQTGEFMIPECAYEIRSDGRFGACNPEGYATERTYYTADELPRIIALKFIPEI